MACAWAMVVVASAWAMGGEVKGGDGGVGSGGEVVCGVPDGGTGVGVAWFGGGACLSAVNVLRRKRYLNRFHGVAEVIKNFLPRTAPQ